MKLEAFLLSSSIIELKIKRKENENEEEEGMEENGWMNQYGEAQVRMENKGTKRNGRECEGMI